VLAAAGHKAVHVERDGAQSPKRLPIPAEFIMQVLSVGLETTDGELARRCGGLVWAYVIFNRPGAAAYMRSRVFRVTADGVTCLVPFFKDGMRQGAKRIATTVPYAAGDPRADKVVRLLRHLLGDHARHRRDPAERLFAPGY